MSEYTNEITHPFFQDLDLALFFILDINTEKIIEKYSIFDSIFDSIFE